MNWCVAYAENAGKEADLWREVKLPWALGVVFPEGTLLEGGSGLNWSAATNVTAVVELPNITWTDNTIYLILSAMNEYGEVIQLAAGLNSDERCWLVYAFYIGDITQYPQNYIWVANRSQPRMLPGEKVALTLHLDEKDGWIYVAHNLDTDVKTQGQFPAGKVGLKRGEQELFALESYTSNPTVFKEMGKAVLESVYINGFRVEGEGYVLGGWDPLHKPLFLVGGGSIPSFIAIAQSSSRYRWVYAPAESWEPSLTPLYVGLAYVTTALAALILALVLVKKSKWGNRATSSDMLVRSLVHLQAHLRPTLL